MDAEPKIQIPKVKLGNQGLEVRPNSMPLTSLHYHQGKRTFCPLFLRIKPIICRKNQIKLDSYIEPDKLGCQG